MSSARRFKSAFIPAIFSCLAIAKDTRTGTARPGSGPGDYQALKEVPQFVLDYAPLVHLYSKESFWPSDIGEHLEHTVPFLNWTKIEGSKNQTVDNVGKLNQLDDGRWIYLKSEDEIDVGKDKYIKGLPTWLTSAHNKPALPELDRDKEILNGSATEMESQKVIIPEDDMDTWFDLGLASLRPSAEEHAREFTIYGRKQELSNRVRKSPLLPGRSSAPAVLLVVEKGEGVVDAFWFYFYSYNLGNSVFTVRFGNHVGDWEHSAIRFYRGVPKAVFLSQHAGGKVYTYSAVEKYGKRPVLYSAKGTHAMYATPGIQPYALPFRILHDTTDRGPLWDPLMNLYAYHYNTTLADGYDLGIRNNPSTPPPLEAVMDAQKNTLTPSSLTPNAPTSWFYFGGHWGDKFLLANDKRQYGVANEKAYVSGPCGPRFKALGRRTVCPNPQKCKIKNTIAPRHWILTLIFDYLIFLAIIWTITGFLGSIFWWSTKCYSYYLWRRKQRRARKDENDVETQSEDLLGEESALLAGNRYTDEDDER